MSRVLLAWRYVKREMSMTANRTNEICSILRGGQKTCFQVKLWGKTRSFNRADSDLVEKLHHRITCVLAQELKRKQPSKKHKNENGEASPPKVETPPQPALMSGGMPVDSGISIEDALMLKDLTLKVGDHTFDCVIDPPRVKEATLTVQPMSGFPVYCDVNTVKCDQVEYVWYVGLVGVDKKAIENPPEIEIIEPEQLELLHAAVERCCTKKNVPKPQHFELITTTTAPMLPHVSETYEGHILACVVTPLSKGPKMALGTTARQIVRPGPGKCPYHVRHGELGDLSENEFRVTSYNILSDALAETDFSKDGLFPYCDEEFVAWSFREHLILDELIGYRSSIVCLQELDKKIHLGNFGRALSSAGYDAHFSNKSSSPEGMATLWKRDEFDVISKREYPINGALMDKEETLFADLQAAVEKCKPPKKDINAQSNDKKDKKKETTEPKTGPKVSGRLILELPHTLQVVHLKHKTGRDVIVANTHLYWHPRGANVRILQAAVCLRLIAREQAKIGANVPVIFCGDFNSTPDTAAVRHCRGETIGLKDLAFYSSGKAGVFKLDAPLVPPITLNMGVQPTPAYTNYVAPFNGTLDYILFSGACARVSSPRDFAHDDVVAETAIPSSHFPSDHLAQVATLSFTAGPPPSMEQD